MIKGIDLSKYQQNVNYSKLKEQGIEFAIIRCGYGKKESQKDELFETHYKGLKEAGIKVGAYLYSYCNDVKNAILEAENCLKFINGKTFELPIFYDLEDEQVLPLGKEKITEIAKIFCNKIEEAGFTAGVYANLNWFKKYIKVKDLLQFKIWLAEWEKPKHSADFRVDFWQYTSKGKLDGISGNVDLNYDLRENVNNSTGNVDNVENNVDNSTNSAGTYVVQAGDNLTKIAKKYKMSWQTLYENNKHIIGKNPNLIKVGQVLNINAGMNPETAECYIVKKGDNLSKIGKKFGINWVTIYENNKDIIGKNPSLIKPGQVLKIR